MNLDEQRKQLEDLMVDLGDVSKLHPELQRYVEELEPWGAILRHPFVYQIPGPIMPHVANFQFQKKTEDFAAKLRQGKYGSALWLYERPYRLPALFQWWHEGEIDDAQLADILPGVWTDYENPFENISKGAALDMFEAVAPVYDFIPGATILHNNFNQPVFRGTSYEEAESTEYGISWTSRKPLAEWFARRHDPTEPILLRGLVERRDILAILDGRGEDEIIIRPTELLELEVIEL